MCPEEKGRDPIFTIIKFIQLYTVSPVNPGSPQFTSLFLIVFTSTFLVVESSFRYLCQSPKLNFVAFLKIHFINPFKDSLPSIKGVSYVLWNLFEGNSSVSGWHSPLAWSNNFCLFEPFIRLKDASKYHLSLQSFAVKDVMK